MLHRFDGYATPKKDAWFLKKLYESTFGKGDKHQIKHAKYFIQQMCPDWYKSTFSGENCNESIQESIERFASLLAGIEQTYLKDAQCWSGKETDFFNMVNILHISQTVRGTDHSFFCGR